MKNICVFVSGRGSNLKAILENIEDGNIKGKVKLVISNREDCYAIEIARTKNIPVIILKPKDFKTQTDYSVRLSELCKRNNIDLICLAGYLTKLPENFVNEYYGKIINIHPALLPSFGGKGFYGLNIHKAVLESKSQISGITIHFVNNEYDKGPIIAQKAVKVFENDTPETLAERILKIEHTLYPYIIKLFCEDRIRLNEGKVEILKNKIEKGIKRALISVSDKTGIVEMARELVEMGIEIIATGGTYKTLKENGIKATNIDFITDFPEILEGRVKTLNNKIFGGILFKRDSPLHIKEIEENDILPIDMVVVNLYPFSKIAQKEENWSENLMENIDIGGVSLIRAAAKNYKDVLVVCDINDYKEIISHIKKGEVDLQTRKKLAIKAFKHTAEYDHAIYSKLESERISIVGGEKLELSLNRISDLRYGENPHQKAALYSLNTNLPFEKLNGKELSYNNLLDAYGAISCVSDFHKPACVIFKHVTPCGIAIAEKIENAFEKAWLSDPISAFGGIIAVNRKLNTKIADFLVKKFIEIIIAPDYDIQALELLSKKNNLIILKWKQDIRELPILKSIGNEILISDSDNLIFTDKWEIVSGQITEREERALKFAFTCVKHVRSNAIVLSNENQTLGIGAGQMSRVDSVFVAGYKYKLFLKNNPAPDILVMASDAFFPFKDAIDQAHQIGVQAIIQPGGSVRDKEVISKAKELGIKMVLTGIRHFRH